MAICYSPPAKKQLRKLDWSTRRIVALRVAAIDPENVDHDINSNVNYGKIRALKGELRAYLRLRVGDYRVLFTADGDTITVVSIEHRSRVYR